MGAPLPQGPPEEIEDMPWEPLDPRDHPEGALIAARAGGMRPRFRSTARARLRSTLRALVEHGPLDLVAGFSRFPLDEMVHVKLSAADGDGARRGGAYADSAKVPPTPTLPCRRCVFAPASS